MPCPVMLRLWKATSYNVNDTLEELSDGEPVNILTQKTDILCKFS